MPINSMLNEVLSWVGLLLAFISFIASISIIAGSVLRYFGYQNRMHP